MHSKSELDTITEIFNGASHVEEIHLTSDLGLGHGGSNRVAKGDLVI